MRLILIRHGKTKESNQSILLGSLPGHLIQEGKNQMKEIAKGIKNGRIQPNIIISSDLQRAKDSAEIISKELELKIIYDPLLHERRGGIAEGKKESEINWNTYEQKPLPHRKHNGGEDFVEVRKRAQQFLKKLRSKQYHTAIIVSHSVFLAMLISLNKRLNIKEALAQKHIWPVYISIKKKVQKT